MAMDVGGAKRRPEIRHQRDAARRRHAGAAHHHDARRADAAEGRRRHSCPMAANTVGQAGQRRSRRSSPSTPQNQFYVNALEVAEGGDRRSRQDASSRTRPRRVVLIKGDKDALYSAIMAAMDDLPQGADRGHRPHHRAEASSPATPREASSHGARPQALRRRARRHGRDPARQRGHERHAAHRRAARAAHHLHGGAAAHAEGRRHQPAARDQASRRRPTPTDADRPRVQRRPLDRGQQAAGHARRAAKSSSATSSRPARKRRCSSSATRSLRYGEIIAVIDAAKGAGVEKVGIVTEGMRKGGRPRRRPRQTGGEPARAAALAGSACVKRAARRVALFVVRGLILKAPGP